MQIKLEKLWKRYGKVAAVKGIDLEISSGALHFFLGPSGCGKTTTLRLIAGLEDVTEGRILFDGKDVSTLAAADRGIGMVFQNYALWPHMTVRKNVEYGLKLRKYSGSALQSRVDDALELTQLTSFADRFPGQLSGGQQQRVALARALAIRPNVLLLDEPLSNLDAKLRHEMRDNIARIHKQTKITTIYVTHDQKEALSMASVISVMRNGHIEQTASPRMMYNHPVNPFIAGFIGETNLVPVTYLGKEASFHTCKLANGSVWKTRAPQFQIEPNGNAYLSFRPEAVVASYTHQPHRNVPGNSLEVVIESLTYLGESEQIRATDSANQLLRATAFNSPDHDSIEGMQVNLWVDAESCLLLPFDANLSSGT